MDPGTFLTALWGEHPPGQAHVWINPPSTSLWYPTFERVNQDLEAYPNTNIYTGVALAPSGHRRPGQRVLASHTTAIAGLWADLDYGTVGHKKANYPPTLEQALEVIDSILYPPTIVINSGHGLQPWWLFDKPWVFATDTDRALAQKLARWWHQHLVDTLAEHGWGLDPTHDLSRVLRLPGTVNHKEDPVPVTIVTDAGPRREKYEYLDLVPIDFQPLPIATPPSTTTQPRQPDSSGPYILNPNAEPPSIKLTTLLQFNNKFKRSWEGNRPDLYDQTASSYDFSLASIALENGWSEQETVDLLIAWRRARNHDLKLRQDYYDITIRKAKRPVEIRQAYERLDEHLLAGQSDTQTQPTPDLRETGSQDESAPPPRPTPQTPKAELTKTLTLILGITINRLTKFAGDPPVYWMSTTEGDITLGSVANLISQAKFRNAVAAATTQLIPGYKPDQWHKIAQTLLRACEEVALGEASHPSLETTMWLESYLTDYPPLEDRNQAAVTRRPFTGQDSIYIYINSFLRYIESHFKTKISSHDMSRRLTLCNGLPETVNVQIGPKRTSRYCWKLPYPLHSTPQT